MNQFGIKAQSRFDYIFNVNPTATSNPPIVNVTWLNASTGEVFICIDNTVDSNIWNGNNGNVIQDSLPNSSTYLYRLNGSFIFNASNGFNIPDCITSGTDFSFSCSLVASELGYIVAFFGANDINFNINASGQITLTLWDGSSHAITSFDNWFNVKTFLALTFKANSTTSYDASMYINSLLIGSITAPTNALSGNNTLGQRDGGSSQILASIINATIYNKVLTQAEITALYNEGA